MHRVHTPGRQPPDSHPEALYAPGEFVSAILFHLQIMRLPPFQVLNR
jgi:hypothetical protein